MSGWLLWVLVACGFGVGEVLSAGAFFLAPFALGGLLAAATDAAFSSELAAWTVFIVMSLMTLAFVRPLVRRQLTTGPRIRTGAAALVGKQAIVLERIANHEGVG